MKSQGLIGADTDSLSRLPRALIFIHGKGQGQAKACRYGAGGQPTDQHARRDVAGGQAYTGARAQKGKLASGAPRYTYEVEWSVRRRPERAAVEEYVRRLEE